MFFKFLISAIFTLPSPVQITLEHADTPAKITWGLMGRESLNANSGMLFSFPHSEMRRFWMFNCNFDLSVAFIDENKMIREIYFMKAYPEMMDPGRPVLKIADMALYPPNDPIALFFHQHGAPSKTAFKYALEVNKNWFKKNNIKPNDFILWEGSLGHIYKSVSLSKLTESQTTFSKPQPVAIFNDTAKTHLLSFFDLEDLPLKQEAVEPLHSAFCPFSASSLTIK